MSFANLHKALYKIKQVKKMQKWKHANCKFASQKRFNLYTKKKKKKYVYETMHVTDMKREAQKRKKALGILGRLERTKNKSEIQENACSCSCRLWGPRMPGQRTKATLHFCLSSRALNKLWTNLHLLLHTHGQGERTIVCLCVYVCVLARKKQNRVFAGNASRRIEFQLTSESGNKVKHTRSTSCLFVAQLESARLSSLYNGFLPQIATGFVFHLAFGYLLFHFCFHSRNLAASA